MKLLVIVLCLLSERYLVHALSFTRFFWFGAYARYIQNIPALASLLTIPWLRLLVFILPIMLLASLVWWLIAGVLYGLLNFLFNLFLIYYCLGPDNPFYPDETNIAPESNQKQVEDYLYSVNRQLFATIFWYVVAGFAGALLHRLATLCMRIEPVMPEAKILTDIMEWIPARILGFLCLLTGNFQRGLIPWKNHVFTNITQNKQFLADCGVEALRIDSEEMLTVSVVQQRVNHALIVLLVILAVFTCLAGL